jgi:hypothetical protein
MKNEWIIDLRHLFNRYKVFIPVRDVSDTRLKWWQRVTIIWRTTKP